MNVRFKKLRVNRGKMPYRTTGTAIIHELLDEEVIIANLDSGVYYSIRETAVPIWQLLLAGHSLSSIAALCRAKYNRDLFLPLDAFVNRLVEENLLEPAARTAAEIPNLVWPKEFKELHLEKYEEMKDLLMLDPIHEVDEQGWPSRSQS
jgi:hypothetical protein